MCSPHFARCLFLALAIPPTVSHANDAPDQEAVSKFLVDSVFTLNGDGKALCTIRRREKAFDAINERREPTPMKLVAEDGNFSIVNETATLKGTIYIAGRFIKWSNGSVWIATDSPVGRTLYFSGERTQQCRLAFQQGNLVAINERGEATPLEWPSPTQLTAPEQELTGQIRKAAEFAAGGIYWSNDTIWLDDWFAGTFYLDGTAPCQLKKVDDKYVAVNESGTASRVTWRSQSELVAQDWELTGNIKGDAIEWSNGSRWSFSQRSTAPHPTAPTAPVAKGPKDCLRIIEKRSNDRSSVLLYLRNDGERPIQATIQQAHLQNGRSIGETKKDHLVHPKREVYIGSPTPDSTGFSIRYTVINAYYK